MFISSSKIHSESYLQQQFVPIVTAECCLSVLQRYILKAIYNWQICLCAYTLLFISSSKIHSESYLQQDQGYPYVDQSCLSVLQRYILKAIYNSIIETGFAVSLFISSSKIHSESYLQQIAFSLPSWSSCLSVLQRYILKAIYNYRLYGLIFISVVYQFFKDTFWKLFTTVESLYSFLFCCLSVLQRYILKAIYNKSCSSHFASAVVYQFFKDTFWKLFTTIIVRQSRCTRLFISSSKIHSESYLQLAMVNGMLNSCCLSVLQRYILKAIYNTVQKVIPSGLVVYQFFKDTFWKLFTTSYCSGQAPHVLFISSSKIHSESYLQLNLIRGYLYQVVYQFFKDTFWKLFTTYYGEIFEALKLFISSSKIHSESYLQHEWLEYTLQVCCLSVLQRYILKAIYNYVLAPENNHTVVYQFFKDTFWKLFTTTLAGQRDSFQLFISSSKIHSESYLQPVLAPNRSITVVYQFFKDTFWKLFTTPLIYQTNKNSCLSVLQRYILKAIYNMVSVILWWILVVYQFFKDTFWKLFTTRVRKTDTTLWLFISSSKIHSESYLQR